ncbi:hypothetical protein AMTRI_Chr09g37040 [Amborella trichopoda]
MVSTDWAIWVQYCERRSWALKYKSRASLPWMTWSVGPKSLTVRDNQPEPDHKELNRISQEVKEAVATKLLSDATSGDVGVAPLANERGIVVSHIQLWGRCGGNKPCQ